jgi:peptide deformylase
MYGEQIIELEEGCLSFPGIVLKVKRSQHIKVRYENIQGETKTNTYTGMTARIIQHECEHLDGEFFFTGLSKLKLQLALKKAKKLGFEYPGILKYI